MLFGSWAQAWQYGSVPEQMKVPHDNFLPGIRSISWQNAMTTLCVLTTYSPDNSNLLRVRVISSEYISTLRPPGWCH